MALVLQYGEIFLWRRNFFRIIRVILAALLAAKFHEIERVWCRLQARPPCGFPMTPPCGRGPEAQLPTCGRGPGARARARAKYGVKTRFLKFLMGQSSIRPREKLFSFLSLATVQSLKSIRGDLEKL